MMNKEFNSKKSAKQIELEKDYDGYNLPTQIVNDSIKIYMLVMMDVTLKRGNRRAMMCKCTYEAYKQNNIFKDPIFLAKKFDVTLKQLSKSQNDFYEKLFNASLLQKYPKKHLDAHELLKDINENMKGDVTKFDEIEDIINLLYEDNMLLKRVAPRDVVIGCIHYFKYDELQRNRSEVLKNTEKLSDIAHTKLVFILDQISKISSD